MKFEFNTDLLLKEDDRQAAKARYPDVYFALDHDELRTTFTPLDDEATRAKKRSRRWGTVAVLLGLIALLAAAAEPLYLEFNPMAVKWIAGCAAAAGVVSVTIGLFGVMFRARKARWLQGRLATERLRQFHFQSIVGQVPEILRGSEDEEARLAFIRKRHAELAGFKRDFLNLADAEMPNANEDQAGSSAWIWRASTATVDPEHPNLPQILAAYETLRFKRQMQYATFKLAGYGRLWRNAPRNQANIFGGIALSCVLLIMLIHALVVSGAAFGIEWMNSPPVHVAAIWTAILALAARTLEEGLQPGREVERLRQYQSMITLTYRRYTEANTIDEKLAAMKQMEEASYEELMVFLKASSDARFVM